MSDVSTRSGGFAIRTPAIDAARARRAAVRGAWIVLLLGLLFLAYVFGASGLLQARSQQRLLEEFASQLPSGTAGSLDAFVPAGTPVAMLEVPALGLRQVVVEGTSTGQLLQGPGHVALSPLPGEYGNAVVLGRSTTFGAPFGTLGALAVDDPIVMTTGQGVFEYRVATVSRVAADDRSYAQPSTENRLTLVTTASHAPNADLLVVVATLEGDPVGVAQRPWIAIAEAAAGSQGAAGGALFALLWGTLFLVAAVTATRLYARWTPLATYLATVPTLLLLLWLTFASAARALPGLW